MRKQLAGLKFLKTREFWLHAGLFAVLFVVFAYLTFPFDAVTNFVVQKIESHGNFRVDIDKLRPFHLSGVKITGLRLRDTKDPRKVYLDLDEARVRIRPTQALRGRIWVDFDLYAYGGGVAGSLCRHKGIYDVAVNFVDIKLNKYRTKEVSRDFGQFDLAGVIGGQMEANIFPQKRRNNRGSLTLDIDQLRIANIDLLGKKFPNLAFEPSRISLALKQQNLRFDEVSLKGDHVELQADGTITVNQNNPSRSRANLTVKFKPSEEFEDALGVIAYALGTPDVDGFYTKRINKRIGLSDD